MFSKISIKANCNLGTYIEGLRANSALRRCDFFLIRGGEKVLFVQLDNVLLSVQVGSIFVLGRTKLFLASLGPHPSLA